MYNEAGRHHGPTGRAKIETGCPAKIFAIFYREKKITKLSPPKKKCVYGRAIFVLKGSVFKPVVVLPPVRATAARPVGGFQNRIFPPWVSSRHGSCPLGIKTHFA